jgi:TRAP-type C4-dicarboxylate transport system substrate-binding protein
MRKGIFFVCLVILVVAGPALCLAQTGSKGKPIEIRLTGHMPVGQLDTVACEKFIKEAETRSNGALKFLHYPAGQLAMDIKAFELCKRGGIEMAQFFTNRAVGLIPETDLTIPYFDGPDWWARRNFDIANGGGLFQKYLVPNFHKQGLHVMPGVLYSPEHSTLTKIPIRKITDYKGMKIRTSGRSYGAMVETWGAKGVVMTSADVYMALQRGTIDAANSGLTSFRSRKWFEVVRHVTLLWEQVSTLDMILNLKWWNSLAPEHKKVIEDSLRVATIWSWEECIKEVDDDIKFLKDKGLEVYDLRKEAPEEWEKMRQLNLSAQEKLVGPTVGPEVWKDHIRMLNATQKSAKTWRQVLETMKW